jgi:hypothetical protein
MKMAIWTDLPLKNEQNLARRNLPEKHLYIALNCKVTCTYHFKSLKLGVIKAPPTQATWKKVHHTQTFKPMAEVLL